MTASIASAQFDDLQNYGDGRTDGGGPGSWSPVSPNGASITAGGGDFWGTSDRGSFLTNSDGSLTTTSDFTATVRHVNTTDPSTNDWGREPLMMRAQAATGTPLDPANPANTNANSANYALFRTTGNTHLITGWRDNPGGNYGDARGNGVSSGPLDEIGVFMAIGRSGANLATGVAADIGFGTPGGVPGRWIGTNTRTHPTIGATTEVTVGIGHQSHNAIPGGGNGANTATFDSFNFNDGSFDASLFGPAPAGDYAVNGALSIDLNNGNANGRAYTFENGAATGEPVGWRVQAREFVTVFGFGVANAVNNNGAIDIANDLVPDANFRTGPGNPGLNADIYLGGNPGNSGGAFGVITGGAPNGSTVIPNVWWTHPGGGPPNGYPNATGGNDDNGGANNTNLFAEAVQPGPGGPFEGNEGNYGVHMTGEIFIPATAVAQGYAGFKDGIDDFTFLRIAGQDLIDDNSWTGIESTQNQGGAVSVMDTSGLNPAGEWVAFEMIMWEGGGGDTAALYWDIDGSSSFNGALPQTQNVIQEVSISGTSQVGDDVTDALFGNIPQGIWNEIRLDVINSGASFSQSLNDVHLDYTPPVIDCANDIVVNVPVGGSPTVSFAHITANDNLDGPVPVTCSPDDSAPFAVGVHSITCEATDSAGNIGTAIFNVVVLELQDSALLRSFVDVSLRGDAAPGAGAGTVGGFPAGATLLSYRDAYLNNSGALLFQASLLDAGSNNFGVFTDASGGIESIGMRNAAAPGGATYNTFKNLALADDGSSSFGALTSAGEAHVAESGAATTLQVGSPPPGLGGAPLVSSLAQPAQGDGDLFSPASLRQGSGSSDAEYVQDFEFPDGTTDLGDGSQMNGTSSVQGGQLRLTTDGVAGGFASFIIPALPNSSAGWTATFDLTIIDGPGANVPADGMSFNYGNFGLGELGSAEEGMAGAGGVSENLSFEIDTWMNFDTEQGVNIAQKVGGTDQNLAFTNGPILDDGTTVSGTVTMSWNPTDGASFSTTGLLTNANFANVPTTFAASDALRFGLSGRVGGANETKLIDNLRIVVPGGGGGSAVDRNNDTLIWSAASGKVAREGDQAAGFAVGMDYGHLFNRVVSSGTEIAFAGNILHSGTAALWSGPPAALAVVAQKGNIAPGTGGRRFASFNSESISPAGSVVFRAGLQLGSGVDSSNNDGLFTNRGGSLALVAREGSLAPCAQPNVEFGRFSSIFIDSDGSIVFTAFLKGASVNSANDSSVWRSSAGGKLSMIAREGDQANNVDGGIYQQIGVVAANDTGGLLINARLVPGIGDVTVANRYGIWRARDGGDAAPELIVRRDDEVDLGELTYKVLGLGTGYVTNGAGGSGGYGQVLNDSGAAVMSLVLSGGNAGVFTTEDLQP